MKKYLVSGAVVLAIAGREKGEIFIIKNEEGDYAYLVNGTTRPINNPKKKNKKHLHLLCKSNEAQVNLLECSSDAQMKNFLNNYNKSSVK